MSGRAAGDDHPERRPRRGDRDPYEEERRRQRRRRREEAARFDPAPPEEEDYVAPEGDRLRRLRAPEPLGDVLEGVVDSQDWAERLRGTRVLSQWSRVVGEDLARRCEPVRLAGGILLVRASSRAWATELSYLTGRIIRRANALVGEDLVEDVQITVGAAETDGEEPPGA